MNSPQQITWQDIMAALPTLVPVQGGYTHATRGIVTLPGGQKVFVKQAVDDKTREWMRSELRAYTWLREHGYDYIPELVAQSDKDDGLALPNLSAWDWSNTWDTAKVDAALEAMDALAELSEAASDAFTDSTYGDNPWNDVPRSVDVYKGFIDEETLALIKELLADSPLRVSYTASSEAKPWSGHDLVHYDVRADNFAYNPKTQRGLLVDWNWAGFGNKVFDQTALLVNVQMSGFDALHQYHQRIDKDSLVWLVGFWLSNATKERHTEQLKKLRPRQVESALMAHRLAQQL